MSREIGIARSTIRFTIENVSPSVPVDAKPSGNPVTVAVLKIILRGKLAIKNTTTSNNASRYFNSEPKRVKAGKSIVTFRRITIYLSRRVAG